MDVALLKVLHLCSVKILRRLAVEHGVSSVIESVQLQKSDLIGGLYAKAKKTERLAGGVPVVLHEVSSKPLHVGTREELWSLTGVKLRRFAVSRGVRVTCRNKKKLVGELREELAVKLGMVRCDV